MSQMPSPPTTRLPPTSRFSNSPPLHYHQRSPRHHPYHLHRSSASPPSYPTSSAMSTSISTPHHRTPPATRPAEEKEDEMSLSLSDEDMLLCDDEDGAFSDAGASVGDNGGERRDGRSRRLLSSDQSKVLDKILDKTHFPSTQLREAAAAQLGVAPRKVQVWFQNRRQVGKKRMMEAVHSFLSTSSAPVSLGTLQEHLRSTGKGRISPNEDERTRGWRRHTIRLALNPAMREEEDRTTASREAFAQYRPVQPPQGYYAGDPHRYGATPRPASGLRIDVPHRTFDSKPPHTAATMLHRSPYTPSPNRPPPVISSQKECFSLPPPPPHLPYSSVRPFDAYPSRHHPSPTQLYHGERGRSVTLTGEGSGGMKEVRNAMTAQWSARQRDFHHHYPDEAVDEPRTTTRMRSVTDAPVAGSSRYTPYPPPPRLVPPQDENLVRRWRSMTTPHRPFDVFSNAWPSRHIGNGSRAREEKKEEEEGRRWSPMDVRSLTTRNLVNTLHRSEAGR